MSHRRCILSALCLALVHVGVAARSGAAEPDLNALAIDWVRGHYASPLLCAIGDETIRGVRRVILSPGPMSRQRASAWIRFIDMQVDEASRCFDSTGRALPNLVGRLQIQLPGRSHPETAARDFKLALRREGGFEFKVVQGALRVESVGKGEQGTRLVDFRGASARFHRIAPATDAARELAEFPSPRKIVLELRGRATPALELPLFLVEAR